MSHPDVIVAFYDHEHELAGESRRSVVDWGGDDLFTSAPRRRRFERLDRPSREECLDRPAPASAGEHAPTAELEPADTPAPSAPADLAGWADLVPAASVPPVTSERRTITVTGHPETARRGPDRVTRSARRPRPAPTLDDRIGPRPDRIAAWACTLGLLLILIAVAPANAAAL